MNSSGWSLVNKVKMVGNEVKGQTRARSFELFKVLGVILWVEGYSMGMASDSSQGDSPDARRMDWIGTKMALGITIRKILQKLRVAWEMTRVDWPSAVAVCRGQRWPWTVHVGGMRGGTCRGCV